MSRSGRIPNTRVIFTRQILIAPGGWQWHRSVDSTGFIRYSGTSAGLTLTLKRKSSCEMPYSMKFSPDGSRILIGCASNLVEVISGKDFSRLFALETAQAGNQQFVNVGARMENPFMHPAAQILKEQML